MSEGALIGIDWGTSNRRAWLFDRAGAVVDARRDDNGVARNQTPGFAQNLELLVEDWPRLPTLMSGMIGSRNGWVETPYVECPAGLAEIAAGVVPVKGCAGLAIVPGLSLAADRGDVMRGEETQIVGLANDGKDCSVAVLPGTHSKWVRMTAGRIDRFRTFPTGDLFGAILNHTVVGALAEGSKVSAAGFESGLARSGGGPGFLAELFAARADILLGLADGRDCAGFLSGLLIGTEVREGLVLFGRQPRVTVVGADGLVDWYARALKASGVSVERSSENATASGLWRIAAAARIVA